MSNELADRIRKVFCDAAILTFAKMTSVDIFLKPSASPDLAGWDLSAVIGFTGDLIGTCALRLAARTAREAIIRLAGEAIDSPMEIADGIGEFVNMIAGNAKAALDDYSVSLSFPEVVSGQGHEISFYRHQSVLSMDFTSDIGDVRVIVAFSEPNPDKKRKKKHDA